MLAPLVRPVPARPGPLVLVLALLLAGCGGNPATNPRATDAPSGDAAPRATATVVVGDSGPLRVEVADDPAERARGLMGRTEVPVGTGMVFRYDAPVESRFYMFQVPVPLTAVFAAGGVVVGVLDMPPCTETDPAACPTYGPDAPFDTVLETAPATLAGKVAVGDPLVDTDD